MEKTICELFAGVGGFRLGFERQSKEWDTVWANQWEPGRKLQHAFDCYCQHFGDSPKHVNEDIGNIDKSIIPNHNLLVGGFPCQDYSVAHSLSGSKGIEGKKGVLWWQIHEILSVKKPAFVLLENVDRLLKSPASQRGRDFGIILSCFDEAGYDVQWRVINAAEYGNVQRRRRIFIFAYRRGTRYAKRLLPYSHQAIMNHEGLFAHAFPIEAADIVSTTNILRNRDLVEISDNFSHDFKNTGVMKHGVFATIQANPIIESAIPIKDILEKDVDEHFYLGEAIEKWEYLKGAKKIQRTSKNGHRYTFSEGPIAFPDPWDRPARTMLTSESSVNRSTHVVEDPATRRLRLITPVEAERIQGFDDDWTKTKTMPERFRYFCMGNALVVPLITRMAGYLDAIMEREPEKVEEEPLIQTIEVCPGIEDESTYGKQINFL